MPSSSEVCSSFGGSATLDIETTAKHQFQEIPRVATTTNNNNKEKAKQQKPSLRAVVLLVKRCVLLVGPQAVQPRVNADLPEAIPDVTTLDPEQRRNLFFNPVCEK
ncbi:uncharacterized protein LOC119576428 [Penaeus monodon]|uniref:uncharacterized protein LOC119576428 n=1 Tax=Penaeus monodon TaxID=6687 RepID=UPI0018A6D5E7|nr:uncharacterized protein LOC119576428 [Penaeus monodon]